MKIKPVNVVFLDHWLKQPENKQKYNNNNNKMAFNANCAELGYHFTWLNLIPLPCENKTTCITHRSKKYPFL